VTQRADLVALLDEWAARFFDELDYVVRHTYRVTHESCSISCHRSSTSGWMTIWLCKWCISHLHPSSDYALCFCWCKSHAQSRAQLPNYHYT
jgi:hypothetical protein